MSDSNIIWLGKRLNFVFLIVFRLEFRNFEQFSDETYGGPPKRSDCVHEIEFVKNQGTHSEIRGEKANLMKIYDI